MDNKTTILPSKRIIPIHAVIFFFALVWAIHPEIISASPVLAIWTFETIDVSEADAREYVYSLIYYLERKNVFRVIDAGDRVLGFVPELSLIGALRKENESYAISIRLDNNYSGETIHVVSSSYSALGELFEDSKRLVNEIVVQYNITEEFLLAEDTLSLHKYVFQGAVYDNQFSNYMDLVERIESQPDISEELKKAIKAYRRKRWSHVFGLMFEGLGAISAGAGLLGFSLLGVTGEGSGATNPDWDGVGRVLLVLGGLTIGGAGFYFLGSALSNPKPNKVVEIYNRDADE